MRYLPHLVWQTWALPSQGRWPGAGEQRPAPQSLQRPASWASQRTGGVGRGSGSPCAAWQSPLQGGWSCPAWWSRSHGSGASWSSPLCLLTACSGIGDACKQCFRHAAVWAFSYCQGTVSTWFERASQTISSDLRAS